MTLSSLLRRVPLQLGKWSPFEGVRNFFAYHGVWAVGVRLLRRWTIKRKILIVLGLTALPMIPMALYLQAQQSEAVAAAELQLVGTRLSVAVDRLMDAVHALERDAERGRAPDAAALQAAVAELQLARAASAAEGLDMPVAWEAVDPVLQRLGQGLSAAGRLQALADAHMGLRRLQLALLDAAGFMRTRERSVHVHVLPAHVHLPQAADQVWHLARALRAYVSEQDRAQSAQQSFSPALLRIAGRVEGMEVSLTQLKSALAAGDAPGSTAALAASRFLERARESALSDGYLSAEEIIALRGDEEAAMHELSELTSQHMQWLTTHYVEGRRRAHIERAIMIAGVFTSIGLALYLFYAFYLVMRGGLLVLNEQMMRISKGDFSLRQRPLGGDEVADTMRAMSLSVERLSELLGSVRHGSSSVSQAAQQIAQGNSDLRARNHQTTEALQRVVDGVARYSKQLEACAAQVERVVTTVQQLRMQSARSRRQMSRLQETLMQVRQHSAHITDAVSLIDGVSFRTNILALNASVEASKAGETGRGFAVVAQEVRSLALRSAEAARRIGDIVASTTGAIEQSGQLADEAGQAIADSDGHVDGIHGAMHDVASLTREGQQESVAILEQVRSLRETTEKNLGLVEQLADASHSLRSHGERLTHRLSHFKLG